MLYYVVLDFNLEPTTSVRYNLSVCYCPQVTVLVDELKTVKIKLPLNGLNDDY